MHGFQPLMLAVVLLSVGGCSTASTPATRDAGSGDSAASDASALDAATADAATSDTGSSDAASADGGAVDAGAVDAGAVDAGTRDSGPSTFAVEIIAPYAYGSCFGGPPDPLLLFWTARVTGPVGDTITLTQATLHVSVAALSYSENHVVTVAVPSFPIPASGTIDQEQRKSSGTPSVPVCTFCSESVMGTLSVTYSSSAGGSITIDTPLPDGVGCVF